MKNFLFVLVALFIGISAQADIRTVVAKYEFGERIEDEAPYGKFNFVTARLYHNGLLRVGVKKVGAGNPGSGANERFASKQLSRSAFRNVTEKIDTLAQAEIQELRAEVVCMMMPAGYMTVNHLYIVTGASAKLELVDGPSGCWLAHQVHPKEEYARDFARDLKTSLETLALDIAADLL